MGPETFADVNLKQDIYEYDPDLELYDDIYKGDKALFFEVNEGIYLAMDKDETEGKNAIYYFSHKVADSLEEFLKAFHDSPDLLKSIS